MNKNIALVLTDNALYKNAFVDALVRNNNDSIKLLIELNFKHPSSSSKKHIQRYFKLLGFKGTCFIAVLLGTNLFKKIFFSPFSKKGYSLKQIAKKNNINYKKISNINSHLSIELLKANNIDFIINSGNQIYKGDILNAFDKRILNRHTSMLPSYGGIYPIFWQLLHGCKDGGVTLHWINEKIDSGEIAYSKHMFINPKKSLFYHYKVAFDISLELCENAIKDLNNDLISVHPLEGESSYYSWPTSSDIVAFKDKSLKIC